MKNLKRTIRFIKEVLTFEEIRLIINLFMGRNGNKKVFNTKERKRERQGNIKGEERLEDLQREARKEKRKHVERESRKQ